MGAVALAQPVQAPGATASRPNGIEPAPANAYAFEFSHAGAGFAIRLPGDWVYDPRPVARDSGVIDALTGDSPDGTRRLRIFVVTRTNAIDFPSWFAGFAEQWQRTAGALALQTAANRRSLRPAGLARVQTREAGRWATAYLYATQFDRDLVWAVELRGIDEGAPVDAAGQELNPPAWLDETLRTLRVSYDPLVAEQHAAAQRRAASYLAEQPLRARARTLRVDTSPRAYLIEQRGQTVGYLTRQVQREFEPLDRPGTFARPKEGVRIIERGWRFAPDGSAFSTEADLFASLDGASDVAQVTQVRFPPEHSTQPVREQFVQSVREADVLIVTSRTRRDGDLPDPRPPIRLDDTYLAIAWARLLPALLRDAPAESLAFSVLDPALGVTVSTMITPLVSGDAAAGAAEAPGASRAAEPTPGEAASLVFELRQGFAPPRILQTDRFGNLEREDGDDETLRRAPLDQVEAQFARQRAQALERRNGRP